jgi:hypothetical protein
MNLTRSTLRLGRRHLSPASGLAHRNAATLSFSVSSRMSVESSSARIVATTTVRPRFHRLSTTSNNDFEGRRRSSVGDDPTPGNQQVEATPTLMERSSKSILAKFFDKYSLSKQTNRILMAESFLQAASSQASDPYVHAAGPPMQSVTVV